jgi:hypothetical protein
VIQHLPRFQHAIIARFRKRNDAEAYVKVMRRMNPAVTYEIMFDPPIAPDRNGWAIGLLFIELAQLLPDHFASMKR